MSVTRRILDFARPNTTRVNHRTPRSSDHGRSPPISRSAIRIRPSLSKSISNPGQVGHLPTAIFFPATKQLFLFSPGGGIEKNDSNACLPYRTGAVRWFSIERLRGKPFPSGSQRSAGLSRVSGTEWGDEIQAEDLPLRARVVTRRLATTLWGRNLPQFLRSHHLARHFARMTWKKGVGLIEYANGSGARQDGYSLKRFAGQPKTR